MQNPVAINRFGIGVEQEFVGIVAMPVGWIPWAMHAKAIPSACSDAGNKSVPNASSFIGQAPAGFGAIGVSHTEIHGSRMVCEERDVDAVFDEVDTLWIGLVADFGIAKCRNAHGAPSLRWTNVQCEGSLDGCKRAISTPHS